MSIDFLDTPYIILKELINFFRATQVAYKYYLAISPADGHLYVSDPEKHQILKVLSLDPVQDPTINSEPVSYFKLHPPFKVRFHYSFGFNFCHHLTIKPTIRKFPFFLNFFFKIVPKIARHYVKFLFFIYYTRFSLKCVSILSHNSQWCTKEGR